MKINRKRNTLEEIVSGMVERVTYHNLDNGFCVLRVKIDAHKDLKTVIGYITSVSVGEHIKATGQWFSDYRHGLQFKASYIKINSPITKEGIERYLGSGLIKGIGPIYAKKLVKTFGEDVFNVIEKEPDRLKEVEGIGAVRSEIIIKDWSVQKSIREIMLFLYDNKVSTSKAVRIYKTYGSDAIKIISENPYNLACDIKGIGFITADSIARKIGIAEDSVIRASAGLRHILLKAMDEGHSCLPLNVLIEQTQVMLSISEEILNDALQSELSSQQFVADSINGEAFIFLNKMYLAEKNIALELYKQKNEKIPWPKIDCSKAIPWVESKLNIKFSDSQLNAVEKSLYSKILVITGGPGVGKTTILKSILTILIAKHVKVNLCAPTGRAAKRLSESTGLEAKTVHRLLEINPITGKFQRDKKNKLQIDLLIVDEASMLDTFLMNAILKALPLKAALILVGDKDQLPSVGAGQVLSDIINSKTIPVLYLREVYRQAAKSKIIINANRINQGFMPYLDNNLDFRFIEAKDSSDGLKKILYMISDYIPTKYSLNPIEDIQVLCPMNRGALGTVLLNSEIKKVLNPSRGGIEVKRFGRVYSVGDKVMQIDNDYNKEVYNGDIGYVDEVNLDGNKISIAFNDRSIIYDFGELDSVIPAYAISIHKSQGSEYPVVIMPIVTSHYIMLNKNLIYTGITRGKKLVVIVGQKQAIGFGIKSTSKKLRYTKLKEWLIQNEKI